MDDPDAALRALLLSFPQVLSLRTARQALSHPGGATAGGALLVSEAEEGEEEKYGRTEDGGKQSGNTPVGREGVHPRRPFLQGQDGEEGGVEVRRERGGGGEGEEREGEGEGGAPFEAPGQASATSQGCAPPSASPLLLPDVLHFLRSEWGLSLVQLRTALLTHPAAALVGSLDDVVTAKRALKKVRRGREGRREGGREGRRGSSLI